MEKYKFRYAILQVIAIYLIVQHISLAESSYENNSGTLRRWLKINLVIH